MIAPLNLIAGSDMPLVAAHTMTHFSAQKQSKDAANSG
jgi:hypothetical protein